MTELSGEVGQLPAESATATAAGEDEAHRPELSVGVRRDAGTSGIGIRER
ncbi:hypothetical protein J2Z21_000352 [Streptomyces griseochromogenes]|uniref:Uncharacterized protein n=1 Tax=Streptomyces griseochromogenes TaxID=68214 RepID=A0ABS4LJ69_9ACTN|nr:hypothetical protein [Streptomyces griseochromogenes]MBP2047430.1 hypothetical protein [Streptomyces griseochromogenes]